VLVNIWWGYGCTGERGAGGEQEEEELRMFACDWD
jgi:hypothetical protein